MWWTPKCCYLVQHSFGLSSYSFLVIESSVVSILDSFHPDEIFGHSKQRISNRHTFPNGWAIDSKLFRTKKERFNTFFHSQKTTLRPSEWIHAKPSICLHCSSSVVVLWSKRIKYDFPTDFEPNTIARRVLLPIPNQIFFASNTCL